ALGLEVAVGVLAVDLDRGVLDPRFLAGLEVEEARGVAVALRPAQVHAQQHLRPVLRLGPARSGVDRDQRAEAVPLAREQALELEIGDLLLDPLELARELVEQRLVALALGQLQHLPQRPEFLLARAPFLDRALRSLQRRHGPLRLLGPVPEARRAQARLEVPDLALAGIDVKDTSATPRVCSAPLRVACGDRRWSAWLPPAPAPLDAPPAQDLDRLARRLLELPHRAAVLERQVGRLGERALGALGGEPGAALLFAPPPRAPEPEELLRLGGRDRQHRVAAALEAPLQEERGVDHHHALEPFAAQPLEPVPDALHDPRMHQPIESRSGLGVAEDARGHAPPIEGPVPAVDVVPVLRHQR